MNKKAFTLIELLVGMALFSVFSLAVFSFCSGVYSFLRQSGGRTDMLVKNALAIDMIYKDMISALQDVHFWDTEKCVWHKQGLDDAGTMVVAAVGWEIIKDKRGRALLRRNEGTYDFAAKKWTKRSASHFPSSISDVSIKLLLNKDRVSVHRIKLSYLSENRRQDETIVLRNRMII